MKNFTSVLQLTIFLSLLYLSATAQNLQLHYDFGKADDGELNADREHFTTTLEMFRPDSLGSTFFFVDMNYDSENGMSFAYWEIARTFKLPKIKNLRLELGYNDGMFIPSAWLVGLQTPFTIGPASISTSLYYRAEKGAKSADAQFTGVWFMMLFKGKVTLSGFVDVWSQDDYNLLGDKDGKRVVFLTEPQLWYNIHKKFALGGEVEFSRNLFTFDGDVEVMPTLAVKWTF
ncbi:DUF5020 family protein [Rapidithrix thailandica]|uniref:DUF5020 family protein n=2 Tax=Rapidithrix thailandica TaxID=413964 RepID=A0AAW9SCT0_9BACT